LNLVNITLFFALTGDDLSFLLLADFTIIEFFFKIDLPPVVLGLGADFLSVS
jgi:hypothetical protein